MSVEHRGSRNCCESRACGLCDLPHQPGSGERWSSQKRAHQRRIVSKFFGGQNDGFTFLGMSEQMDAAASTCGTGIPTVDLRCKVPVLLTHSSSRVRLFPCRSSKGGPIQQLHQHEFGSAARIGEWCTGRRQCRPPRDRSRAPVEGQVFRPEA